MDNEQRVTTEIKAPNKNQEALRKHFGQCFDKSGNFDIEKFKKELSENEIDFYKESYGLDWLGKSYARILASDEATTLLREDQKHNQKKENKNSQNLLIKGDNLEVLKHLSNAYYEKIKMIYIDPPYNTGSDGFVYHDDRKFTADELKKLAGIDEEKAKRVLDFTKSKSNSHSAWLTFMYPRLYVAKQLLKNDGVIFVSIDDNEVSQLRILMDEIFGEENFIAQFVLQTNPRGRSLDKYVAKTFEYIISYSKVIDSNCMHQIAKDKKGLKAYRLLELRNRNPMFNRDNRPNLFYPIYINPKDGGVSLEKNSTFSAEALPLNSKNEDGCWTWSKNKFLEEKGLLLGRKTSTGVWRVFRKDYIPANGATTKEKALWIDKNINHENGKEHLGKLFNTTGNKIPFSFPKSVELVQKCLKIGTMNQSDLILDFFAGSGTTGDAVMQLNAEDGGSRQYILVQLPEKIDSKESKTAYDYVKNELKAEPTIFEITKERLIRASKKTQKETIKAKIAEKENEIKALNGTLDLEDKKEKIKLLQKEIENLKNQDLGFKVFETIPIWDDYSFEADELNPQAKLFDECELTFEDLKALLITWKTYDGIALTENLVEIDLDGYTGYFTNNKLYLMHKGFTTDNLKHILEKIDSEKNFNPTSIVAFGYLFESKNLREISENVKSYANKKHIDIDFITRY
jgi:adenine-specific DNA-methyltransferase